MSFEIRTGYAAFRDDPRRKRSGEVDFGVHWYERKRYFGVPWPSWRVSWIEETGELYAVELIPDADSPKRRYLVFGRFPGREQVEARMAGWADGPFVLGPLENSVAIYERAQSR